MSRSTAPLTEPTSETMAPGAMAAPISAATAPQAPTGTQTMMQSAPFAASALVSTTWSAILSSRTRSRVACERAVATIERTAPSARAARAFEEPISPTPISARRSKITGTFLGTGRLTGHELAECGNHELVRLFGTDAHAERIRQVVSAGLPQYEAALHQECVGIFRRSSAPLREMDEDEIGNARRHLKPERADVLLDPGEPFRVVRDRALEMRGIAERGDAGRHRRRVDVKRPANAIHRIDHGSRRIHPAKPKCGEAMDLGEGPRHHGVFAGCHELNARFVVVAADVFGIGRIDHQKRAGRERCVQP